MHVKTRDDIKSECDARIEKENKDFDAWCEERRKEYENNKI